MAFSLLPLCGVNMRGEEIRYSHTNYERCSPGPGNGAALVLIDPLQIRARQHDPLKTRQRKCRFPQGLWFGPWSLRSGGKKGASLRFALVWYTTIMSGRENMGLCYDGLSWFVVKSGESLTSWWIWVCTRFCSSSFGHFIALSIKYWHMTSDESFMWGGGSW